MTRGATRVFRIIGWLVATGLLVYCLREANAGQVRRAVELMQWRWILLALSANAAILLSWSALWWTVAPRQERPTYRTMFEINAIASALMNTVPLLGGHAAAVVLLMKLGQLTQHGALSVMALDQLGEGVTKVAIFSVVAISAPIPDWMRVAVGLVCVGVIALFFALIVAAHRHVQIRGRLEGPGFVHRSRVFVAEWASRLETLRNARQSVIALTFAAGTKIAEGAGLFAVQHSFGVELSVSATVLVLAAVVIGSMIPVAPGNVGTYEAAAFLAYRHLGVDPGMATMLAIASHLCFLVPSVGIGYLLGSARHLRWWSADQPAGGAARPS